MVLGICEFLFELQLDVEELVNYSSVELLQVLVGNLVDTIDLVRIIGIYIFLGIVLIFGAILSLLFSDSVVLGATLEVK